MAFLAEFGSWLPERIVTTSEAAAWVGAEPQWAVNVSGIEERRFAAEQDTVADLAARAAQDCLARAGLSASELGLMLVASGSGERQFPGPAAETAFKIGLSSTPAIDLPLASAGSLFGLSLASQLAPRVGPVLVVAAEKMSRIVAREPKDRGVAILFGDGAGACLVSPAAGFAEIVDSWLASDGSFAGDLCLEWDRPLKMNGRMVILQASRKLPNAIRTVLDRNGVAAADVLAFLMHQANQNLIVRVAEALGVEPARFYSNIARYGNTSAASMLIAAAEWRQSAALLPGQPIVFAGFGAGFHWGALLARTC
jgi:3-oxoacyl-[acyl-carrier-protein] synthase-3